MKDFRAEWNQTIAPALLRKVSEAGDRLLRTRGERFSYRTLFYPRTEFDQEHGVVLLSTQEDIVTPRMVSFTVYRGVQGRETFYKLFVEAYTTYDEEEPLTVEFDDEMGRNFECRFYRNAESFKLRIEETNLDQVFFSLAEFIGILNDYPVSVLHDILNASLNTLIEEANAITYSFSHASDDNYVLDLSNEQFKYERKH